MQKHIDSLSGKEISWLIIDKLAHLNDDVFKNKLFNQFNQETIKAIKKSEEKLKALAIKGEFDATENSDFAQPFIQLFGVGFSNQYINEGASFAYIKGKGSSKGQNNLDAAMRCILNALSGESINIPEDLNRFIQKEEATKSKVRPRVSMS